MTPLVLASGDAVLVNRGWVATDNNVTKPDAPAPSSGQVTIEGWLRKDSGAGSNATVPSDGQIRAISSTALADHVPYGWSTATSTCRRRPPNRPPRWQPSPSRSSDRVHTSSTLCSGGSSRCWQSSATSGSPGPRPRNGASRRASTVSS
ncbi:SURF1 family cytochrome oxidase biogenesis protein [Aeromicrobium sp. UC242_57]|uniref:SURF1 family cytochrome oxidase biogenesis protein n=1 Tax=Aeromicrobium sp. UC242_57 TaxID=3374624 RepID=UPI0037AB0999